MQGFPWLNTPFSKVIELWYFFSTKKWENKKKGSVVLSIRTCSFQRKQKKTYPMTLDREILEIKRPSFWPCPSQISGSLGNIKLKILSQTPHFSPNICWKFQLILTFLDRVRLLRGGEALRPPPPSKKVNFFENFRNWDKCIGR